MVVVAMDDQAAAFNRRLDFDHPLSTIGCCGADWWTASARSASRSPPLARRSDDPGFASPASRSCSRSVWWQWTTRPRLVMTEISKTARPDLILPGGQDRDVLLGALAAYLRALEARIGALERRSSAVPLMTAADGARIARVNVETILRAVRAGELPVAGYVGSPRISRDALVGWLATRSPSAPPVARQPRRGRGRKASGVVEAAWQRLG